EDIVGQVGEGVQSDVAGRFTRAARVEDERADATADVSVGPEPELVSMRAVVPRGDDHDRIAASARGQDERAAEGHVLVLARQPFFSEVESARGEFRGATGLPGEARGLPGRIGFKCGPERDGEAHSQARAGEELTLRRRPERAHLPGLVVDEVEGARGAPAAEDRDRSVWRDAVGAV